MPNKKSKTAKTDKFVPILFADSMEEAEVHCQLLQDHGITALAGSDPDDNNPIASGKVDEDDTCAGDMPHGIPVFVHKSDVDGANKIISEHEDISVFGLGDDELNDDDGDEDFGMGPDMGEDDNLYDPGGAADEMF